MSKTLSATLVLSAQVLLAGVVAGNFRATITDAANKVVATKDSDQPTLTFEGLTPGDYTISALRLDSTGAALSTPVNQAFTVPADQATADVPVSITVSLA